MIERIKENEKRLDSALSSIKELEKALNIFQANKKNIKLLDKYYGSKNWFKDKELYESGNIKGIKAGVLSEDSVWNMLDDINYLVKEMKKVIKEFE